MRRALVVTAVLLIVPLAGCLGGSDDDGGEPVQKQRAEVSGSLGGIEGIVTDTAVQPVAGANVTLAETNITVRTADDGSYAFSRVQPGTYTLVVRAGGFVSAEDEVVVRANDVATADFILAHLVSELPYTQALEFTGFVECGVGWRTTTGPQVGGVTRQSVAVCAAPNLITGANATNDRFLHSMEFDPPIETLVYEMVWEANGATGGAQLSSSTDVTGFLTQNGSRIISARGASPLYVRVGPENFEDLQANFTARCEEGDDAWCGQNFRDQGWPLTVRVFAYTDCLPTPATACVLFQQDYTHFFSAFYNAPAPEGYSVLTPV